MHDLLSDRLIRVDGRDGSRELVSLPMIYEAMLADEVAGFPALRPHQRHAWHAFLAQASVLGMVRSGLEEPPTSARDWYELLSSLTPGFPGNEPWQLVVRDMSVPAFLQCPTESGLSEYKKSVATPDDLDLLATAKNHEIKTAIAHHAGPEDWVFSLIDLQTMSGFLGKGNYGVARMNGGFSSRPCIGLAPAGGGPGAHLAHDMRRMAQGREELRESHPDYFDWEDGVALLWLAPWDGRDSLTLGELDPHFIEICRRVRLTAKDGRIEARTASSKKQRVAAKEARGNVGDHWTPVALPDGKALSISQVGFRYDRLAKLVLDSAAFKPPPAMKVGDADGESWRLIARGVAGGQGKTAGYHERSDIVLRASVTRALMGSREDLATLARQQITEIKEVSDCLAFGIAIAASGGKDAVSLTKADRQKAFPYRRRLDAHADGHFFSALQERYEASEEDRPAVRQRFAKLLIDHSESLLLEAIETVPCPQIRRHRGRARAVSAFWGKLWRSSVFDMSAMFGNSP